MILISLDIYHGELFFIALLAYGLMINFFLSGKMTWKLKVILTRITLASFFIILGLGVYINYYLPHGRSYPTGEFICQNDGRGPCGEQYKEDLRGLNIPDWAKFLRSSEGELLLFGLLFAWIVISTREKTED